jgi:hypothetical protein
VVWPGIPLKMCTTLVYHGKHPWPWYTFGKVHDPSIHSKYPWPWYTFGKVHHPGIPLYISVTLIIYL